jgi:hypothetical protein
VQSIIVLVPLAFADPVLLPEAKEISFLVWKAPYECKENTEVF